MGGYIFPVVVEGRGAVGLLVLRLVAGVAFLVHGFGKIQAGPTGWMGPDAPISPIMQGLATAAEFFGGVGWLLGFLTPLASLGILAVMTRALQFHFERGDPFINPGALSYEPALVFWAVALLILLIGPGRYSLDAQMFRSSRRD